VSARSAKRRRPTPAQRIRPFWLLIAAAAVLLAVGAVALARWPALRPHAIEVVGASIVSKRDVLAQAAIDPQTNIWIQNTGAMRKRIESLPYVKDASIARIPPANVRITIEERAPYAVLASEGQQSLVDHDLRVLAAAGEPEATLPRFDAALPPGAQPGTFLTDAPLLALRDDEDALRAAHVDAVALAHDRYGDLVVTLRGGVQILFGEDGDLGKKIPLVQPILTQVARKGRPIAAIDLRAPATPVVVYKQ